jgi:hypothetical protein
MTMDFSLKKTTIRQSIKRLHDMNIHITQLKLDNYSSAVAVLIWGLLARKGDVR